MEPSSKIEAFPIHIEDKSLEAVSELAQASYAALLRTHKASQAPRASGLEDNFRDGLPPDYIAAFSKYMVTKYDWRKHEKTINAMGQHYRLSIQDVPGEGPMKMHFVHTVRSDENNTGSLPLLPRTRQSRLTHLDACV